MRATLALLQRSSPTVPVTQVDDDDLRFELDLKILALSLELETSHVALLELVNRRAKP